jgi:predicted nucleotidyltransferase
MKTLRKDKLVVTEKAGVALQISASLTEPFRQLKRVHNLEQIYESGLIDYLNELYRHPQAIVLFGSYSRGEDTERSDTDIAILTDKHLQPTMATFEKKIGRPISIHEVDTSRVSEEFKNSLCNGVVLEGAI